MPALNVAITKAVNLMLAPFGSAPWVGLIAVSVVTGAVLLAVFRYTSNQRGIRRAKNQIVAGLLEVLLYRDDIGVVMRAQLRLAKDNLRYLGYALVPLVFMVIPVGILLVQTDLHYGRRPLNVGETAIVDLRLKPGANLDTASLSSPEGVEVETAALRIPALNEVDWRVRAARPGSYDLHLKIGAEELTKNVIVGHHGGAVPNTRVRADAWSQFLHPGEPPLPRASAAASVTVTYPGAEMRLLRWRMHWIWPWLVISMLVGYALKGPLRVQV
jgi:hypothetical protein